MEGMSQIPEELVIPVQTHETNYLLIGDAYLSASSQQRQEMLHGVDAFDYPRAGILSFVFLLRIVCPCWYMIRNMCHSRHSCRMERDGSVHHVILCCGWKKSLAQVEKMWWPVSVRVSHWLLLKWVRKCTKHFRRMVLICPVFLSGKRKPENIISTCGKRTECKSLLSVCRPDRWSFARICTYIHHDEFFSRQGVWALSPDGFCRGS